MSKEKYGINLPGYALVMELADILPFVAIKLYGREAEVKTLLTALERVAQGNTELLLIAGFPGIGKTTLLILGAYRDNEILPAHSLLLMLAELQQAQIVVDTITLTPLSFANINQMVADALNCDIAMAQPLTGLINHKTQGNPFFTTQFLKALYEDGYIYFNNEQRYWECDVSQINTIVLTDDLVQKYPQFLNISTSLMSVGATLQHQPSSNNSNSSVELDLFALFNAIQTISSEVELSKLIAILLNITLANAGADKVVLLLQAEQGLQIVALIKTGKQPEIFTSGTPLAMSHELVVGVVNWVKYRQESLILAKPQDFVQFAGDRYLQQHHPQSILCSPILHQGKLLGILYLENRLTSNVFTLERLNVLTVICSQAAIAIENARLFNAEQEKSQALKVSLAQLQQSELRFQNLFEKSTDAIVLVDSNSIIDCNEAAIKMFGYSCKSQLCNFHPSQISPVLQPGGQPSLTLGDAHIAQALVSGSHRFEWVHQHADGKYFWVEIVLTPIALNEEKVLHAILRDISDRKTAESKLEFTQFAVDNSADGIAWLRPDGSFAYGNQAMCAMLGYSFTEFCQLFVWDIDDSPLISPAAWPIHWQHLKEVGRLTIESEHHSKDSNYYPVEISLNYFEFAGEEYNFVQARNITDRKQTEIELRSTNQRLERSISELQSATRLKDEFLAAMSHELRTPLNAILGLSEALQEEVFGDVNDRQIKSLRTIERSGRHLLSLINDILDVSKISAGKLELETQIANVAELCKSSLALIKQQAYNKKIQLKVHVPADAGVIYVDERRIRQVLINLLSNAVKFTDDGGVVTLAITRKDPQLDQPGGFEFAVTDTGIGIAPADCKKLFEPFIQVDSRLSRQYQGTGLGLTLVKQIVELHGGSIEVKSVVGAGSCFTVCLPQDCLVGCSDTQEINAFDSMERVGTVEQMQVVQPPTILLAEDNEANIETFSSYLKARGYQTRLATNGRLALDLIQHEDFNLILMDIQMPEMDGLEAISQIRQQSKLCHVPIIAITALAMEGDRERCLAAGADDYLTKPIKLKQLHETIQHWLDKN